MTRKEAIAFFRDMNECTYGNLEAVEMAIKALEQEPCEDAVSRQAVLDLINSDWKYEGLETDVASLPSVNPQKIGHWIMTGVYYTGAYETIDYVECSCCGEYSLEEGDYCPNCGAKMVEQQEREDTE